MASASGDDAAALLRWSVDAVAADVALLAHHLRHLMPHYLPLPFT